MGAWKSILIWTLTTCITVPQLGLAAGQPGASGIPKQPSAPPTFGRKAPPDPFRCTRRFVYNGKVLSCDSNLYIDGEGLRPVISNTQLAVEELTTFQKTLRRVLNAIYPSTIGITMILGGLIASRFMKDESGNISADGRLVRNISAIAGLAITTSSIVWGLSVLNSNEQHLHNAVQFYNEANPGHPIELQISATAPLPLW